MASDMGPQGDWVSATTKIGRTLYFLFWVCSDGILLLFHANVGETVLKPIRCCDELSLCLQHTRHRHGEDGKQGLRTRNATELRQHGSEGWNVAQEPHLVIGARRAVSPLFTATLRALRAGQHAVALAPFAVHTLDATGGPVVVHTHVHAHEHTGEAVRMSARGCVSRLGRVVKPPGG